MPRDVADLLTLYGITSEQTRMQALELALLASTRAGGRPTVRSSPPDSRPT